jgi:hypothetical protein
MSIKIIDISAATENLYFCCLEDWSDEMSEAGDHKQKWYTRMKDKGVRVKLAQQDNGVIGGMIQYMPIEHSMFEGNNLACVRTLRAAGEYEDRIRITEYDTLDEHVFREWGISDGIFIDGKELNTGPLIE